MNVNTNDAGSLSLSEYAVLAIAPELAPKSLVGNQVEDHEWEQSTVAEEVSVIEKEGANVGLEAEEKKKRKLWRRLVCL